MISLPSRTLRIVVTCDCNCFCRFCHHEGVFTYEKALLTTSDIKLIVSAAQKIGVRQVCFTGGEPLLLSERLFNTIHEVSKMEHIKRLWLDTNGFLLSDYVEEIVNSGLQEIHVSYPSCERERSEKFFGRGYPKENIDNSLAELEGAGIEIALNALLVQGINYNEEDIESLLNYALLSRFRLRFFNELENYHNTALFVRLVEDVLTRYNRTLIRETERIKEYRIRDTIVVEIIDPCTPEFCNPILWNEIALFLTPSGKVKRMFGEQRYELLGAVRSRNVERIEKILELAVQRIIYGHDVEGELNAFRGTEKPT